MAGNQTNTPPTLGQHQEEILGTLGYTKDDIKAMKDKLAI